MINNIFKIIPIDDNRNCLLFHPNQSELIDETKQTTIIRFGLQEMEVTCKQLNTLEVNEIGLSNNIIKSLQFPLPVDYEIAIHDDCIIFGPFIGILCASSQKSLKRKVKELNHISEQYPSISGLLVAFSWEGMDHINSQINGYIYDPYSKQWKATVFPFPTVIVKDMKLPKERKNYLKNLYGPRFFYRQPTNKWKTYKWISTNPKVLPYLPKTILYKTPEDILKQLKTFRTIYVKPILGSAGVGIQKFGAESDHFYVKYRNRKHQENKTIYFSSENELLNYIKSKFKRNRYIVQQGLDLEIEKDHTIDFRIGLIKNQSGQWEDVGMSGRRGSKGSIVSNTSNGGVTQHANDFLINSLNLSDTEIQSVREKMSEISILAAKEINKFENIYLSAVDIAIDRSHHIWIIELNTNYPGFNDFANIGLGDALCKINNSALYYAKYLAGFALNNENENAKLKG